MKTLPLRLSPATTRAPHPMPRSRHGARPRSSCPASAAARGRLRFAGRDARITWRRLRSSRWRHAGRGRRAPAREPGRRRRPRVGATWRRAASRTTAEVRRRAGRRHARASPTGYAELASGQHVKSRIPLRRTTAMTEATQAPRCPTVCPPTRAAHHVAAIFEHDGILFNGKERLTSRNTASAKAGSCAGGQDGRPQGPPPPPLKGTVEAFTPAPPQAVLLRVLLRGGPRRPSRRPPAANSPALQRDAPWRRCGSRSTRSRPPLHVHVAAGQQPAALAAHPPAGLVGHREKSAVCSGHEAAQRRRTRASRDIATSSSSYALRPIAPLAARL